MKSFTILIAVSTAVSRSNAIPTSPNDAAVASCLEDCSQTFCEETWPQSCYCHNAHALECWYECGGVQPQLQECPPQTTSTTGSSGSSVSAPSSTSSIVGAPATPTGSIVTELASSITQDSAISTLTTQYKRNNPSKPIPTSTKPTNERLRCLTESKQCPSQNMQCIADTPTTCTTLFYGACDLAGTCEIIEINPSPPIVMPIPSPSRTTRTRTTNSATHSRRVVPLRRPSIAGSMEMVSESNDGGWCDGSYGMGHERS